MGMATIHTRRMEATARAQVSQKRWAITSRTGLSRANDSPKSPRTKFEAHITYLGNRGMSRPYRSLSSVTRSSALRSPRPSSSVRSCVRKSPGGSSMITNPTNETSTSMTTE